MQLLFLSHGLHVSSGLSVCVISFRCVLALLLFFLFFRAQSSYVFYLRSFRWKRRCFTTRGRGLYIHSCPRPCLCTCRQARLSTHRHTGPHSMSSPCSDTHFWPCNHHMCVIAKELGAVLTGSHMQRNMDISYAPPRLGAPFLPFLQLETVHVSNLGQHIGDNVPSEMAVLRTRCTPCSNAPLGERQCLRRIFQNVPI